MATTDQDRVIKVGEPRVSGLDRFFKITERGSSVRTEIIAGFATWLTMAYILFVNPAILGSVTDSAGTTLDVPAGADGDGARRRGHDARDGHLRELPVRDRRGARA